MKKITLIFLTAIILFACKEGDEKPPFDNIEFYENHEAANWTKETAKVHLQGKWKLIYTYCCPMSPNSGWVAVDDDHFILEFKGDSVQVFTDNNLEQIQYWEFDERYEDAFYLETNEPISNTFGTIYFSENYMFFNASPFDGSDNYFEKVE
ncbi:hypothetical protein QYS49_05700 [Marivirga salinae]|uniref:Uncharacterized protein n=1 Tax=Marivirga salinarum TaxID=3059078 RepID=A0AA49JBV1_9BACT|nr:hypothetical protein [Marivirga sp. BDSF4-3]WKK76773.1 hypothetical protein QYS49_05700 [Marivirga sp. BDSF4-3]